MPDPPANKYWVELSGRVCVNERLENCSFITQREDKKFDLYRAGSAPHASPNMEFHDLEEVHRFLQDQEIVRVSNLHEDPNILNYLAAGEAPRAPLQCISLGINILSLAAMGAKISSVEFSRTPSAFFGRMARACAPQDRAMFGTRCSFAPCVMKCSMDMSVLARAGGAEVYPWDERDKFPDILQLGCESCVVRGSNMLCGTLVKEIVRHGKMPLTLDPFYLDRDSSPSPVLVTLRVAGGENTCIGVMPGSTELTVAEKGVLHEKVFALKNVGKGEEWGKTVTFTGEGGRKIVQRVEAPQQFTPIGMQDSPGATYDNTWHLHAASDEFSKDGPTYTLACHSPRGKRRFVNLQFDEGGQTRLVAMDNPNPKRLVRFKIERCPTTPV